MERKPTAIIDVGSNSVRLVVYSGERRVPSPIFNEKVLAGLGDSLTETGAISRGAAETALRALKRFKLIVDHIDAGRTHLVATAAIRDASNGPAFVKQIRALGLPCRVLGPEEEATLAGLGVISAIPWAHGVVGDLGGGSLELVEVADGQTSHPVSLPLGVLRMKNDRKAMKRALRKGIRKAGLRGGGTFYMVGGSWRALARIDMIATDYPLPILQQYRMIPARAAELAKLVQERDSRWSEAIAPARLASSPIAANLLAAIVDELEPARIVVSTYGIREGLLYSALSPPQRRLDPLVSGARELSEAEGPTGTHGDSLEDWLSGAFDDPPELARIRHAACLLADVAWRANPVFRAERAVEMALHGNWVGVDAQGRVLMAQALSCAFDDDDLADAKLLQLCKAAHVQRAKNWGLAIRAGQRLSGGVASVLRETRLDSSGSKLKLEVPAREGDLVNDGVLKRLTRLAGSLDLKPVVEPV
jgi:exopolyphosphatase/guanosine-5'-triphosphate,3'-diphosphate pyrophosphatase